MGLALIQHPVGAVYNLVPIFVTVVTLDVGEIPVFFATTDVDVGFQGDSFVVVIGDALLGKS